MILLTCGIYLLENKVTGQLYVGQSKNIEKRFRSHINMEPKSPIDRSLRKYGHRRFIFNILCECEESELNNKEREYVDLYDAVENKHHFNVHPPWAGVKNFYRLTRNHDNFVITGPGQRKIKYSKNKKELEDLIDKLNKKLITEDDLKKPKCYHVSKTGVKFNKQQYTIITPDNRRLISSFDLDKLKKFESDLNNGVLTEKYFERDLKKYRVIKYGSKRGNQYYALVNDNGDLLKSSMYKEKLDNLAFDLNNNVISEEDINPSFKIVKNGKTDGRQRYSIKNKDGKILKSSTDYDKLNNLISELMKEE